MQTKAILVLANSIKKHGRCLAGKELIPNGDEWEIGGWIRPVETEAGGEINRFQMSQALGHEPQLLEIIEIPFSKAVPLAYQPENWLLETPLKANTWKSHGVIGWPDLERVIDHPADIWFDPSDDRRRVHEGFPESMPTPASLYLIKPDKIISAKVWTEHNTFPGAEKPTKRKRVLTIKHNGRFYDLDIDDPTFADKYYPQFPEVDQPPIEINLPEETIVCASLTGPYHGHHYKIAAAILEPSGKETDAK